MKCTYQTGLRTFVLNTVVARWLTRQLDPIPPAHITHTLVLQHWCKYIHTYLIFRLHFTSIDCGPWQVTGTDESFKSSEKFDTQTILVDLRVINVDIGTPYYNRYLGSPACYDRPTKRLGKDKEAFRKKDGRSRPN